MAGTYGPEFTYQEYLKFDEPLAWLKATGVTTDLPCLQVSCNNLNCDPSCNPCCPNPVVDLLSK